MASVRPASAIVARRGHQQRAVAPSHRATSGRDIAQPVRITPPIKRAAVRPVSTTSARRRCSNSRSSLREVAASEAHDKAAEALDKHGGRAAEPHNACGGRTAEAGSCGGRRPASKLLDFRSEI
ncbi:hypothetical protein F511_33739 [Dorcoceras hygrometricum]|uniref:Uncharacterized protein n=1 Tax=Dorcoceras hygrometricum TaxID=472368 RepID=A0A2Z7DA38_9LAMI|nr:hypothetical protein F511_33739 [Dorcoceras hygrometricum]